MAIVSTSDLFRDDSVVGQGSKTLTEIAKAVVVDSWEQRLVLTAKNNGLPSLFTRYANGGKGGQADDPGMETSL
ncbi:hypothetical protein EDD85DRAFT_960979 [Armillaria nabsnona]|nr:hypothetical protein EDD85DRAFT_960979 [Armillaria nabsnona]